MTVLKIILNIIIIILAIAVLALVVLRIAGFSPYIVKSGSMSPLYEENTIIFAKKVKFKELKQYDIIVFLNSNNNRTVHRIMEIDEENKQVITKGDNNRFIDILPVYEENIIGKVGFKVPYSEKLISKILNIKGA